MCDVTIYLKYKFLCFGMFAFQVKRKYFFYLINKLNSLDFCVCDFRIFKWNSIFGCNIFVSKVQTKLCWCFLYYMELRAFTLTCAVYTCVCICATNVYLFCMYVRVKWFEQIGWSTFYKLNWKDLKKKIQRNTWAHKFAPFLVKNWKQTHSHIRYTFL